MQLFERKGRFAEAMANIPIHGSGAWRGRSLQFNNTGQVGDLTRQLITGSGDHQAGSVNRLSCLCFWNSFAIIPKAGIISAYGPGFPPEAR